MKEYKFKINGNAYKVAVESVQDGIAAVSVNGTPYKVEIENDLGGPKPVKPVQVAPATYQATPQAAPVKIASAPPAGGSETQLRSPGKGGRYRKGRADSDDTRGHEDGEQHRRQQERCGEEHREAGRRFRDGRGCINNHRIAL